jgi:hypothetical protein
MLDCSVGAGELRKGCGVKLTRERDARTHPGVVHRAEVTPIARPALQDALG